MFQLFHSMDCLPLVKTRSDWDRRAKSSDACFLRNRSILPKDKQGLNPYLLQFRNRKNVSTSLGSIASNFSFSLLTTRMPTTDVSFQEHEEPQRTFFLIQRMDGQHEICGAFLETKDR